MAYSDYEHCPGCDAKVIYTADVEVPEDVVTWHTSCLDAEITRQTDVRRLTRAAEEIREYGQQMSGGGWDIWNTEDYILEIYPLAQHIEAIQRHGAVYRRTIIVVSDWKRLRKGAKS